ncbi:MAG: TerD family protein [Peptostreptococcaceae bacterium]|jgi:stress response protein SCP2|nr:TerD family protein [Peptostreptococcaceae bacterium]
MAINLTKGQRISLTKETNGLSNLRIGLGWDPAEQKQGFLGALLKGSTNIDCDASILMLDSNGKIRTKENVIYFGNLRSSNESVIHMGDNLTGEGEGDDEQILIDLNKIPSDIDKLVFVVNIYDCKKRNQHFGMIKNAYIRVMDSSNNNELLRYNLTDSYSNMTALTVAEIYRHGQEWKFAAVGEGTNDVSLSNIVRKFN